MQGFFLFIGTIGEQEYFDCTNGINLSLLEMMGRRYVIDFCISSFKQRQKDLIYKIYVTDALKAIVFNSGHMDKSIELNKRFYELINPQKEDTRTPEEIIAHIKKKLRGH